MNWPSEVEITKEWIHRKTNGKSVTWIDALEWVQQKLNPKSRWSIFMLQLSDKNCVYIRVANDNGESQQKIYVDLELVKKYLEGK